MNAVVAGKAFVWVKIILHSPIVLMIVDMHAGSNI